MGVVRWRSTSYAVDERGVHYQTGIVSRKATTVPLSRIQGLDTVAGPVQRLFGVVALHVQSAGGGKKGEIVLEAVGPAEVERIRTAVRAERPELPEPAAARDVIERRLGRRELVVAALTAGQLGVILPVLAASGQLLSNAFSNERDIEGATRLLPDTPGGWELTLAALLVGAWALSAIGSLVSFAGFTVSRDGDRLRIRRGLLQRSDAVVPIRRIHAVRVVEGVLRRPFGLATLRLEVAGYAEEASAARTLHPLLPLREVAAFLAELLPELADEPDGLAAPPPRAARRYVLPPGVLGLIAGAAACLLVPSVAPWPLLVAPLLGLNGWWSFRAAGWRLRDGRLAMRSRRLARTTLLTPAARLQEHAVVQNPFQRRAGLADLAVAVGKGGHARVRHLEAPVAAELWERLRR
jgi:putative membrane protein